MNKIYKITNTVNGKVYIGKTCRDIHVRFIEHIRESRYNDGSALHKAIAKYGKENFTIEIIEENIPTEYIDYKEQYYIKKYKSLSHENGYNITSGGDGGKTDSKLTWSQVRKIKEILLDENNLLSFTEIGALFDISGSVIQSINCGTSWYEDLDITYPLRKYSTNGLTICKKKYCDIVKDLRNTKTSFDILSKKYNISEEQLTAINFGKYCYNNNNYYYKNLYNGTYPIRDTLKTNINFNKDIIYDILFSEMSYNEIGIKYNIKGNSLQYIAYGKRHKEYTKDFLLPLRKYINENKIIYLQKYKGGED